MKYIKSIKELRSLIKDGKLDIDNTPGIYRWWFKEEGALKLLENLPPINDALYLERFIEGEKYLALYFGISKTIRDRIKWHICQNHTPSTVESGYLSTLRQTISALLHEKMTASQDALNDFIDNKCYLEWDYATNKQEAEEIENKELSQQQYAYPLNIAKNETVSKEHLKALSKLRSDYNK